MIVNQTLQECARYITLERMYLPCAYLAHHEPESIMIRATAIAKYWCHGQLLLALLVIMSFHHYCIHCYHALLHG